METGMNRKKWITVFVYAVVGWMVYQAASALAGLTPIASVPYYAEISAVLIYVVISWVYFRKFKTAAPLQTAAIFSGTVVVAGLIVFALSNLRFLGLYASMPRTWLRFALIFVSIYLTGYFMGEGPESAVGSDPEAHSDSKTSKAAIVAGSAVTSALGSAVFGFFILIWFWGAYEGAVLGAFVGFGAGLIVGILRSVNLLSKSYSGRNVIMNSLLTALLISGLLVMVFAAILAGLPS